MSQGRVTQLVTEEAPEDIDPTELDIENADEWTEAEVQAYNEHVEQELDERIEEKETAEAEAISILREDAQETLDTATVTLEGEEEDFDLEVKRRIPPAVESMVEEFDEHADEENLERARLIGCRMIAEMVVGPSPFDEPNIWLVSSKDGSAGIQWLQEKAKTVLKPARKKAGRDLQGNSRR